DQLEAILARQHNVKNDGVEAVAGAETLKRILTAIHDFDPVSFRLQIELEAAGEVRFVFHHQQVAHAASLRGSRMVMVAPCPSPSLSAKASPPCLRAMERTRKSPSPVPFTWAGTLRERKR